MYAEKAKREWERSRRETELVRMRKLCRRLGVRYAPDEDDDAIKRERAIGHQERPEAHYIGTTKNTQI